MVNNQMLQKAKELANRPYQLRIFRDETTEDEPVYVAVIPELPGCHAFGDTPEDAKQNLSTAKIDFIYFLLEDELVVPEPRLLTTKVSINMTDYIELNKDNNSQSEDASALFLHS